MSLQFNGIWLELMAKRGWHLCKNEHYDGENKELKIVCIHCQNYNEQHPRQKEEWTYTFKMPPWKIRQGYYCPSCVERNASIRGQHYINIVNARGGTPMGSNQIMCKNGHLFYISLQDLEDGDWCPACPIHAKNRDQKPEIDKSKTNRHPMSDTLGTPSIRIVILCAKFEEAAEVRRIFKHLDYEVQQKFNGNILFHSVDFEDHNHRPLHVDIFSCADRAGAVQTAVVTARILQDLRPHWVFMTGVCAGNPTVVNLGDLIVAERAIDIREGKVLVGEALHGAHVPTINRYLADPIKEIIDQFHHQKLWSTLVTAPRPVSQRYKKEVLLKILYDLRTSRSAAKLCTDESPPNLRDLWGQDLHQIQVSLPEEKIWEDGEDVRLLNLLTQEPRSQISFCDQSCKYYLNSEQYSKIRNLVGRGLLPQRDPTEPKVHMGVIGTDVSSVRSDLNTKEAWSQLAKQIGQKDLIGLEMEGVGLYETVTAFNEIDYRDGRPRVKTILIKGVSDLADQEKDDRYHKYGKQISAAFVYEFLRQYGYQMADKGDVRATNSDEKKT